MKTLLIIVVILVGLFLLGKKSAQSKKKKTDTGDIPLESFSRLELMENLTLLGNKDMTPVLLEIQIENNDEARTAAFFARYSVTCSELDLIINAMRRDENVNDLLSGLHFSKLEIRKLMDIYDDGENAYTVLTPELLQSFGEDEFIFNYRMYEARISRNTRLCVVPSDDHYRPRFEQLAEGGVALRGESLPPGAVLEALTMKELRELAAELGVKEKFSKRADILTRLKEIPEAENKVREQINIDDAFYLSEPTVSQEQVERAWHAVTHYVRIVTRAYYSRNPNAWSRND